MLGSRANNITSYYLFTTIDQGSKIVFGGRSKIENNTCSYGTVELSKIIKGESRRNGSSTKDWKIADSRRSLRVCS